MKIHKLQAQEIIGYQVISAIMLIKKIGQAKSLTKDFNQPSHLQRKFKNNECTFFI